MRQNFLFFWLLGLWGWGCQPTSQPPMPCHTMPSIWAPISSQALTTAPDIQQPLPLLYFPSNANQLWVVPFFDQGARQWLQRSMPLLYHPTDSLAYHWSMPLVEPRKKMLGWSNNLMLDCQNKNDTLHISDHQQTFDYRRVPALTWSALEQATLSPTYWTVASNTHTIELMIHRQRHHLSVFWSLIHQQDSSWICGYYFPERSVEGAPPVDELACLPIWQSDSTMTQLSYCLLRAVEGDQLLAQHYTINEQEKLIFKAQKFNSTLASSLLHTLKKQWTSQGIPTDSTSKNYPLQETDLWWVGLNNYTIIAPSRRWIILIPERYPPLDTHRSDFPVWNRLDKRGFTISGTKDELFFLN